MKYFFSVGINSTYISYLTPTMVEKNYWTNGKICAKVTFPRYTESVKFRSQSRETASKRKPYRGLGTCDSGVRNNAVFRTCPDNFFLDCS